MHIGIAGPIWTESLRGLLELGESGFPAGLGPTDIAYLVRDLVGRGHTVSIYTLSADVGNDIVLRGKNIRLHCGRFRPRGRERMKDFFAEESKAISRFIVADKPDVVHAFWTYEFAIGGLKGDSSALITVCDWAPTILRHARDLYRLIRLMMGAFVIVRGKNFSAVSPYIADRLHRYRKQRYPVIPNMVEDSVFLDEARHLNVVTPEVMSINNGFGSRKNTKRLLCAFKEVHEQVPGAYLTLIGHDFGPGEAAEMWARRNGLDRAVKFHGFVPPNQVGEMLKRADLLVHPSREESFGMALVEAMARRTPVIGGTKSGAVPWVLDYGRAGILVDVNSPRELAEATVRMLSDEKMWSKYAASGYRHAWENFRVTKVVDQYLDLYSRLLQAKSPRR